MQNKKIKKEIGSFDGIRRNSKTKTFDSHQSKSGMLYSGLKMTGVISLALILLVSLSNTGSTMSYFSDVEKSIGNYLRADPLYFTVVASPTQIDLSSGEATIIPVMTPGLESELAQYFVRAEMTGGDKELCNSIQVLGTFPFPYDGPILGISTATTTDVGSWTLTASLTTGSIFATSTSCSVDLVYKGWNADSLPGKGYSDTQKITLMFFVLTESASTTDDTTVNTTDSTTDAVLPSAPVPEDLEMSKTVFDISSTEVVNHEFPAPDSDPASAPASEIVPKEVEISPTSISEVVPEPVLESAPEVDSNPVPQADLTPASPPT